MDSKRLKLLFVSHVSTALLANDDAQSKEAGHFPSHMQVHLIG